MSLSSHAKRWLTGLTALPFLIFWLGWGSPLMFALLIALVCLLSLREYFHMTLAESRGHLPAAGRFRVCHRAVHTLGGICQFGGAYSGDPHNQFSFVRCFFIAPLQNRRRHCSAVAMQIQGMVYIPVLISGLIRIRNTDEGILWIFFLLAIVFAGDIGAYYAGSYLGRRKLCPSVSPNKTIEGSIGGLCANMLIGAVIKAMFLPSLPWAACMVMFLLIGAAGQIRRPV